MGSVFRAHPDVELVLWDAKLGGKLDKSRYKCWELPILRVGMIAAEPLPTGQQAQQRKKGSDSTDQEGMQIRTIPRAQPFGRLPLETAEHQSSRGPDLVRYKANSPFATKS